LERSPGCVVQEREAFKQEAAQSQEMHERMMDMAKGDMDQARLAFAEEVENWTKKRNAELTDIHRIRREMDADGAKRASDLATFAANVTRALSGLEYALAKQDEDTVRTESESEERVDLCVSESVRDRDRGGESLYGLTLPNCSHASESAHRPAAGNTAQGWNGTMHGCLGGPAYRIIEKGRRRGSRRS
jgi:hypothetical protein